MTDYEFTQIMRDTGYEVAANSATIWKYKKLPDCFCLEENRKKDSAKLYLGIYVRDEPYLLYNFKYTFENISKMNSIEFKKWLNSMTEYTYSLYKDINRHIDALSTKMETKANRLGM